MKINFASQQVMVSAGFAKRAAVYGSEEYKALRAAMNELPGFQIVITKAQASNRTYVKGMTYEWMEAYIADKSGDNAVMEQFQNVRRYCGYFKARSWFLKVFPEVGNSGF